MQETAAPTVCVDCNSRGVWEVRLPEQWERIPCETLDDARRMAYLCAVRRHPCQLIVRDAYHRVLQRELVDSDPGTAQA
jgi:hypothetical protein